MLVKRRIGIITVSMLSGALALWFTACTESKKSPTNDTVGTDGKTDADDDDEVDDEEADDDEGEEAGDMCDDGVKKAGMPDSFDSLIDAFCDEYRSDIESSSIVYGRSDYEADNETDDKEKILVRDEKPAGDNELSYLMFASNELEASAEDYFKLNKLRNNKPDVYKDHGFKVNESTTVCNVEPGDTATKYEALNDAEKDLVHYTAETKYKKVSSNIYVIYTELEDNFDESLRDLKTFSVIIGKGSGKSSVYTAAYQVAFKNSQEDDVVLNKAKKNLREEMYRNFANAQKADEVSELEDEESDPPTSCEKP